MILYMTLHFVGIHVHVYYGIHLILYVLFFFKTNVNVDGNVINYDGLKTVYTISICTQSQY